MRLFYCTMQHIGVCLHLLSTCLQSFMGNQQKLAEIFTKGIIVNIAPKMRIVIACQVSTQLFCIQYQSIAIFYLYLCAKFHEDWLRAHGVIHNLVKLVDSQSVAPVPVGTVIQSLGQPSIPKGDEFHRGTISRNYYLSQSAQIIVYPCYIPRTKPPRAKIPFRDGQMAREQARATKLPNQEGESGV